MPALQIHIAQCISSSGESVLLVAVCSRHPTPLTLTVLHSRMPGIHVLKSNRMCSLVLESSCATRLRDSTIAPRDGSASRGRQTVGYTRGMIDRIESRYGYRSPRQPNPKGGRNQTAPIDRAQQFDRSCCHETRVRHQNGVIWHRVGSIAI